MAMLAELRVGILGVGNMGGAILRGLVGGGHVPAARIVGSRPDYEVLEEMVKELGFRATPDNKEVARHAEILVVALKPGLVAPVLEEVRDDVGADLVMSVAAGVPTVRIEEVLGGTVPVVRAMPNTPALVGRGVTAYCAGSHAGPEALELAAAVLKAVGEAVQVEEHLLDAVTATSGSGPAYFFHLVEALAEAGQRSGLPPELAAVLARETFVGAARLLDESDVSATDLRIQVTSPGGTTEAALKVLGERAFRETVAEAVAAATRRGKELGGG
jgi:pyrroline-5-carboxylate reductase